VYKFFVWGIRQQYPAHQKDTKQKIAAKAMSGQAAQTVSRKAIDGFDALRSRVNQINLPRSA